MLSNLEDDAYLLAYMMSNISERAYYAGWMKNLEFVLWHAVLEGKRSYGHTQIDADDIRVLKILSGRCSCWIHFDEELEETVLPLEKWKALYREKVAQDTHILK